MGRQDEHTCPDCGEPVDLCECEIEWFWQEIK